LIQEHLNYNNSSIISSYSKTDIKEKQTNSETLKNLKGDSSKAQEISTLQTNMRGGRNIVVPKISKMGKKPLLLSNPLLTIGNGYTFHNQNLPIKSKLISQEDYLSSYFAQMPPTTLANPKLPPIKKNSTPKPTLKGEQKTTSLKQII
jgi:hypothetical protein